MPDNPSPERRPPLLRHLCLMVPRLEPAVATLRAAFGLEVAHREPLVGMWDVENAVMPVGTHFLECCAPLRPGSAAARYLAKHPQGGAYLLVMACDDLPRRRARLDGMGIRVVTELCTPGFRNLQMHPRDTGACMLEFNHHSDSQAPLGPYAPAGPAWQRAIRTDWVDGLSAVEVRSRTPERLAAHWGRITETPVTRNAQGPLLRLGTTVRFALADDDEPQGIAVVELSARHPEATLARALRAGVLPGSRPDTLALFGLDFRLVPPA